MMTMTKEQSEEKYHHAILMLLALAKRDISGSKVAAQVLLSAYNGSEWQLDITDLCLLDNNYFNAALHVICGRVNLSREPQLIIVNGNEEFKKLSERWKRYHVKRRYKVEH